MQANGVMSLETDAWRTTNDGVIGVLLDFFFIVYESRLIHE